MKGEFTEYLTSLGMGGNFIQRVGEFHEECQSLVDETINDVFVSDQHSPNGRLYRNLCLFTEKTVFKLENFIGHFHLETRNLDGISRCTINKSNFNFKNEGATSAESLFQLVATWEPGPFSIQLTATQANCTHLLKIAKKYVFPRLILHN